MKSGSESICRAGSGLGRWLVVPVAVAALALSAGIGARLYSNRVWDDAYVFVRYARNVLAQGAVTWNPGGEPTYGATSLLFLVVVVPLELVTRADAAVVAAASSLLCGLAFLAVLGVLLWRRVEAPAPAGSHLAIIAVLFTMLASIEPLSEHFASGMDTTFTLLFLAVYIMIALREEHDAEERERSPSARPAPVLGRNALPLGILGGLAYWARPDLMLYTLAVPASMLLLAPDRGARGRALLILALTAGVAGVLVLCSWLYFDSPLPLPFYAKCRRLYEDTVYAAHRDAPAAELGRYLRSYGALLVLVALRFGLWLRHRARRPSGVEVGLLCATLVFIAYYARFVLQITALHQRFYYPTLPALAFLGARSAAEILRLLPAGGPWAAGRTRAWAGPALGLALAVWPAAQLLQEARQLGAAARRSPFFVHSSARERYKSTWIATTWFRLDEFSDLPDDLVMAMTEFGFPAAMNPGKTIVDLTGLNNTEFAHHGFSADALFGRYRPDLIFMPWRDYSRMLDQISAHPEFRDDYEYFAPRQLGTSMGLALRRSSKYYSQMQRIARSAAPPRKVHQ